MERMPSASEMERYKQEMMNMYRRANPTLRQTPVPPVRESVPDIPKMSAPEQPPEATPPMPVAEPVIPPSTIEPETPPVTMESAAPSIIAEPTVPITQEECTASECPAEESTDHPLTDIRIPHDNGMDLPDFPSIIEMERQDSTPPTSVNQETSTMPRYPEDSQPESRDERRPRASDIPTEQGTGEPAAAEEDDMLGIAEIAYPGEVLPESRPGPRISPMDFDENPYVIQPLPDEYKNKYPETGYIRVKVSSSNQALPVKGAGITISKNIDSKNYIIHQETTDRSGLTQNLPLPAPDDQSSMTPSGNGTPRFAVYDMLVQRDGYVPVIYRSIPVFSGVVTVQPVQMVPQTANPDGQKVIEYEAPSPDNR